MRYFSRKYRIILNCYTGQGRVQMVVSSRRVEQQDTHSIHTDNTKEKKEKKEKTNHYFSRSRLQNNQIQYNKKNSKFRILRGITYKKNVVEFTKHYSDRKLGRFKAFGRFEVISSCANTLVDLVKARFFHKFTSLFDIC